MKKTKVLILAGGGIFGTIGSTFISYLSEDFMNEIDVIGGTSIGGVQTCCYASGANKNDILNTFINNGKDIFSKRFIAKINPLSVPTYSNKELNNLLKKFTFGKKVKDIKELFPNLNFVVPTINLTYDEPKVFDNISGDDDDVLLSDIGLMTSAAPTYFPSIKFNNCCMIDAGLYDVTGLLSTVTAIKGKKGIDFKDMDVLMIGTGTYIDRKRISYEEYESYSILGIGLNVIIPYTTLASERAANYWGKNMGFNSFNYYNPIQIKGKMDDTKCIDYLLEECEMYKFDFLNSWDNFLYN